MGTSVGPCFKAHDHIYFVMDIVNGIDFYYCVQQYEISEVVARFYMSQAGCWVSLSCPPPPPYVCAFTRNVNDAQSRCERPVTLSPKP